MNGGSHGKSFHKQHLVDGHTGETAEQETAKVFFTDAGFLFPYGPDDPEKHGTQSCPQQVKRERSNKRGRDKFDKAVVDSKKYIRAQNGDMGLCSGIQVFSFKNFAAKIEPDRFDATFEQIAPRSFRKARFGAGPGIEKERNRRGQAPGST
jgi:hypothetical protein